MRSEVSGRRPPPKAMALLGGEEAWEFLDRMVSLAPVNLEDPVHRRTDKSRYPAAASAILERARGWGLAGRVWDAREELPQGAKRFPESRPNVIIDLPGDSSETLLLLAHYDVVPVPEEQRHRWKTPPHELTYRADGRLYGRGSNDDLGSGVLASLRALQRLAQAPRRPVTVRFIACCDEETGGAGGIEALREHDESLGEASPERLLRGELALIPDGSDYVAAGSSGVSFLDLAVETPTPLSHLLLLAQRAIDFHGIADSWRSQLAAPRERGDPPHPTIAGRATLTRLDLRVPRGASSDPRPMEVHAESLAANQIPASVTISLPPLPGVVLDAVVGPTGLKVPPPFALRWDAAGGSQGGPTITVSGISGHGGYPHEAANPVPIAVAVVRELGDRGIVDLSAKGTGEMTLDLRSPPEMEASRAVSTFREYFRAEIESTVAGARLEAPVDRTRSGYFLPVDHPMVRRVENVYEEVAHRPVGVYGEFGGTDASALRTLRTPGGAPLPAIVFGAMDARAHIHDAEESLDPARLREVVELLVRMVETWNAG